jgi:hypothetical protein
VDETISTCSVVMGIFNPYVDKYSESSTGQSTARQAVGCVLVRLAALRFNGFDVGHGTASEIR